MVVDFVGAIEEKQPVIFDTSPYNVYTVPLDADARQKWLQENGHGTDFAGLNPIFDYIDSHYAPVDLISNGSIVVYEFQD